MVAVSFTVILPKRKKNDEILWVWFLEWNQDLEGNVTISNDEFVLANDKLQCYPNPFNPSTTIQFFTKLVNEIEIKIFNIKGQVVKEYKVNRQQTEIIWNVENHTSGIYFVNLIQNGKTIQTVKITLIK